jgi:hypothetical protein
VNKRVKEFLNEWITPSLRDRGFTGTFPILRRVRNDQLDILEVQFSKYGNGFRLNLGVCPASGVVTTWGEAISPNDVTTAYPLTRKLFLSPRHIERNPKGKHWFEFDEQNAETVVKGLESHLDFIEKWFLTGEPKWDVKPTARSALYQFLIRMFGR